MGVRMAATGKGWAAASLDDLGDGPGFRKIRKELGVTAFGVNAIVLPPGVETGRHYHDEQEELYFVHRGTIEMAHTSSAGTTFRVVLPAAPEDANAEEPLVARETPVATAPGGP